MRIIFLCSFLCCMYISVDAHGTLIYKQQIKDPITTFTEGMTAYRGYFNFWWDNDKGKIWLEIPRLEEEFLYVNSLAAGIGSNDIGLDRGQLGRQRIVKFIKSGPKVLLVQPNYDYRAISDNQAEQRAVAEAFAQSVLWGFKVKKSDGDRLLVDATDFLLQDVHQISLQLKNTQQGTYILDTSRSVIYLPNTKSFPKNSEFESLLTFRGNPEGEYIRQVGPSPEAISVRLHHSFVQLPEPGYKPRVFDPRSGYYPFSYFDYATPIEASLKKRFITRHRLEKKDPSAAVSEAVEPIIYYLDPGTPEPVRSALLEGASWWSQAFESAGYQNAFQVKMLPEGANPLDVRYNVIQWVHRSTRGWSYGSTVIDPRTGEIIKGHVSLGSLRVRQDFLIAQSLSAPFSSDKPSIDPLLQMALARLRQLSAHEVGHTLGLTHNFASSVNDRASVMDYPHPYIQLKDDGQLDFSKAYDQKIGEWDKRTILYGYQDFPQGTDETKALDQIIRENIKKGLLMISDKDARPVGGAHPSAHLWDNSKNATSELTRLMKVRNKAMERFGLNSLKEGQVLGELEEVLVPLYLAQRYQVEAVAKLIGGIDYAYALKGDGQQPVAMISATIQQEAIQALLKVLEPKSLAIPEEILQLIPPKPIGYARGRESFQHHTGPAFDPVAAAESVIHHTLSYMLHHERAARMIINKSRDASLPDLEDLIGGLLESSWYHSLRSGLEVEIGYALDQLVLQHLMVLANNKEAMGQVRAIAHAKILELEGSLANQLSAAKSFSHRAHLQWGLDLIRRYKTEPEDLVLPEPFDMPAGSPIGMRCAH